MYNNLTSTILIITPILEQTESSAPIVLMFSTLQNTYKLAKVRLDSRNWPGYIFSHSSGRITERSLNGVLWMPDCKKPYTRQMHWKASVKVIFLKPCIWGDAHYVGTYMNVAAKWQSHRSKSIHLPFGNNKVKAYVSANRHGGWKQPCIGRKLGRLGQ